MLVAKTILRTPMGGCWNMSFWSIIGMLECTGGSKNTLVMGTHHLHQILRQEFGPYLETEVQISNTPSKGHQPGKK